MTKQKEGTKHILVVGMEFATLHRGKHFRGFPNDGQQFNPEDFTPVRLASMLASGALKWETITTKTITPAEHKAGHDTTYPTPFDKEN